MTDRQFDDEPPPWIVSAPPPEGGRAVPPGPGPGRLILILALAVVLLAAGGLFLLHRNGARPGASPPPATQPIGDVGDIGDEQTESVPEPPPTTEAPTETPTVDPEQAALDRLEEISGQDQARVTPHGQYVAQLASKNPGTYDPLLTTAAGSHTFQATDILREHLALRDDPANGGTPVVLLKSTGYGKRQLYHGRPLYVTFALGDFAVRQDVVSWCARRFPALSGDALGNQCAVRRLQPAS